MQVSLAVAASAVGVLLGVKFTGGGESPAKLLRDNLFAPDERPSGVSDTEGRIAAFERELWRAGWSRLSYALMTSSSPPPTAHKEKRE